MNASGDAAPVPTPSASLSPSGSGAGSVPASAAPGVAPPGGRLDRDALTRAAYATLATWAWFAYGFGAVLPLLRVEEGASRTVAGLHSLIVAGGALVAGVTTVPVTRRLRRRGALRFGLALFAAGAATLAASGSPAVSLVAVGLIGTGGAMMINAVNPSLSEHHGVAAPAALSEGNAIAAAVGLLAPLAVGIGAASGPGWRPAVLILIPLAAVVAGLLGRVAAGTALDASPPARATAGPLPVIFWLLAGMVMAAVGMELAMMTWSADLVGQRTGMSPAAASAAVTAVVAGVAAGRTVAGRLALRVAARSLLIGALGLSLTGWALTWVATSAPLAVLGLATTGLGIAGLYPVGMSLALASVPGRTDRATGALSFGIGASAGLSPFALGALADATGTHSAFLVIPALTLTAVVLLLASGRVPTGPATAGPPVVG